MPGHLPGALVRTLGLLLGLLRLGGQGLLLIEGLLPCLFGCATFTSGLLVSLLGGLFGLASGDFCPLFLHLGLFSFEFGALSSSCAGEASLRASAGAHPMNSIVDSDL